MIELSLVVVTVNCVKSNAVTWTDAVADAEPLPSAGLASKLISAFSFTSDIAGTGSSRART